MKGLLLHDSFVYTSFADAPDDVVTIPDGDNSKLHIVSKKKGEVLWLPHVADAPLVPSASAPLRRIVPLPRTLHILMKGVDVKALQRALSRAGYRKWGFFTENFGSGVLKQLKAFQRAHGLKQDGIYGPATHAKLKSFYDLYGTSLMVQEQKILFVEQPQQRLLASATLCYNNRDKIGYTEGPLRMWGVTHHIHSPNYPITGDCSAMTTWYYYDDELPDPNNLGYDGEGFTGTECLHGVNVSLDQLQIGDLVFYGYRYPYKHVAIYVGNGKVISHGSAIGPLLLPVNYRSDARIARRYITKG